MVWRRRISSETMAVMIPGGIATIAVLRHSHLIAEPS